MARRSDNTREELNKMAIAAGIAILEESGIEELSARKIATRIGYTVGTLYNVFEDYDDLIIHINAATMREMHEALKPIAAGKKGGAERVLALAHCYVKYATEHPARWGMLTSYSRKRPLPDWFHTLIGESFAIVEQPLLELTHGDQKEARCAARVLWAGLHGICSLSLGQKLEAVDAASPKVLVDHFIKHYLKGLAAA